MYKRILTGILTLIIIPALQLTQGCEKKEEKITAEPSPFIFPDFSSITDISEKKQRFFAFMRPYIDAENERIRRTRKRLSRLYGKYKKNVPLTRRERSWLVRLADKYRVKENGISEGRFWELLLRRVDIVPTDLALVQAAKESGWGTSRFAKTGYNLFGQRCFREGCGIVPNERGEGEIHEVKSFESVEESVRSYIHNLNTGPAYSEFRTIRYTMRQNGFAPDGYSLIPGLPQYSERGETYLEELKEMIAANKNYTGI